MWSVDRKQLYLSGKTNMSQNLSTVRAAAEPAKGSAFVPGCLGLDLYVAALAANRDALRAPRLPQVQP